jgi:hypothetical protein
MYVISRIDVSFHNFIGLNVFYCSQPSAAAINRGLPPAIPDYHGEEDDDEVEYVQPDDDIKVKQVANVVNKGRVPPIPAVNRTQNKVNNSVPAPPNRPSAAKPPAVTITKEIKQVRGSN